jgi:hypothetical protein
VILAIASVGAQSSNELIGAWELTEWTNPDGDPVDASSMIVYSAGHYIWLATMGDDRPDYAPGEATDAQRVAAFRTLATNGGSYSISGNRSVSHPTIAKHAYQTAADYTIEGTFVIEGDSMTFTNDNGGIYKFRRLD